VYPRYSVLWFRHCSFPSSIRYPRNGTAVCWTTSTTVRLNTTHHLGALAFNSVTYCDAPCRSSASCCNGSGRVACSGDGNACWIEKQSLFDYWRLPRANKSIDQVVSVPLKWSVCRGKQTCSGVWHTNRQSTNKSFGVKLSSSLASLASLQRAAYRIIHEPLIVWVARCNETLQYSLYNPPSTIMRADLIESRRNSFPTGI